MMKMIAKYILSCSVMYVACLTSVHACSIHFTVTNQSGHTIYGVQIAGPWFRASERKDSLKDGASMHYRATGSMFTCHGKYHIDTGSCAIMRGMDSFCPDGTKYTYGGDADVRVIITSDCDKDVSDAIAHDWQYGGVEYVCKTTWSPDFVCGDSKWCHIQG